VGALRKGIAFLAALLVLAAAFSEMILPGLASATVATRLKEAAQAQEMDVSLRSEPGVLLLFGQIDTLHAKGIGVKAGQIVLDEVTLDGSGVHYAPGELLSEGRFALTSARTLQAQAIVTEGRLLELLQEKAKDVENLQVTIAPDLIRASGEAKVFGHSAAIELEGKLLAQDGGIYFHMTRLQAKGLGLRNLSVGDYFGDILLTKLDALPLGMQVDNVEQQQGRAIITASKKET